MAVEVEAPYVRDTQPSEWLPADPFVTYILGWLADHPDESVRRVCERAGISFSTIYHARTTGYIALNTLDKLLVSMGCAPDVLHRLYPLNTALV